MARHPDVRVEATLTDRVVDLAEEGFEAALRIGTLADSSVLVARALAPYRLMMCASPAYLARHGTPHSVQALARHQCLSFEPSALAQWLQGDAGGLDRVPDGRLQINNGEALRSAALHGLGIVLQSTLLLGADVDAGRLVQLFPEHGQAGRPMHVVYAHDRYRSTRLRSSWISWWSAFHRRRTDNVDRLKSRRAWLDATDGPIKPLPLGSQEGVSGCGYREVLRSAAPGLPAERPGLLLAGGRLALGNLLRRLLRAAFLVAFFAVFFTAFLAVFLTAFLAVALRDLLGRLAGRCLLGGLLGGLLGYLLRAFLAVDFLATFFAAFFTAFFAVAFLATFFAAFFTAFLAVAFFATFFTAFLAAALRDLLHRLLGGGLSSQLSWLPWDGSSSVIGS